MRGLRTAGVSLGETCRRCGQDEWKYRGNKSRYCVPCDRNKARQLNTARDPAQQLLYNAKLRAKRNGLPFSLTLADVDAAWPSDDRCPVLGIELKIVGGRQTDSSPTLDRMNNAWGYEPGNIAVVSWRANRIKADASANDLERVATWMKSRGLS